MNDGSEINFDTLFSSIVVLFILTKW